MSLVQPSADSRGGSAHTRCDNCPTAIVVDGSGSEDLCMDGTKKHLLHQLCLLRKCRRKGLPRLLNLHQEYGRLSNRKRFLC